MGLAEDVREQLEVIKQGCVEVIEEDELKRKLELSISSNSPLVVKTGFDPSAPDLHLGHTVLLNKMRQFQNFGHKVVFLIGDFTGMIGDPSGQSDTRPALTKEQVLENARTYKQQVFKILDQKKTEVRFNSEWMESMSAADVVRLASRYTVARMLERDDFARRYKENRPISIHEFLYPLVQAYDSVALKADVELGGTDQKFNLVLARHIQRSFGQTPQVILTLPLLVGIDGVQKMSKSLGNSIGIDEPPREIFGKVMRISDEIMLDYYELLTDLTPSEVRALKKELASGKLHPMDAKKRLAFLMVERFWSTEDAKRAQDEFERVFSEGGLPDDIPEVELPKRDDGWDLASAISAAGLASSRSEAKRLVGQGGVTVDEGKVEDFMAKLDSGEHLIKVGKRKIAKVKIP